MPYFWSAAYAVMVSWRDLLLSALLYAPGALQFSKARRELGNPLFTTTERLTFAAVLIVALIAAMVFTMDF